MSNVNQIPDEYKVFAGKALRAATGCGIVCSTFAGGQNRILCDEMSAGNRAQPGRRSETFRRRQWRRGPQSDRTLETPGAYRGPKGQGCHETESLRQKDRVFQPRGRVCPVRRRAVLFAGAPLRALPLSVLTQADQTSAERGLKRCGRICKSRYRCEQNDQ